MLVALREFGLGMGWAWFPLLFELMDGTIQLLRPILRLLGFRWQFFGLALKKARRCSLLQVRHSFRSLLMCWMGFARRTRSIELSKVLEVSRGKFIRKVVIPGAMPFILSGLRVI